MSNELVALSRAADERSAAVWSSYPQVAVAEQRVAELETRVGELAAEVARRRSAARSRKLGGADAVVEEDLRGVRAELRAARAARKDAKAAVKIDARDRLREVSAWVTTETKRIRQEYAAAGLHWGTYNDVIAHHQAADKRVRQRRTEGLPAQRRFKRWDGSGSLAVQLQRDATQPPRTVDRLGVGPTPGGKTWTGQLQLPQEYGRRVKGTVRFGVGAGAPMVEVPVAAHRPLADDADVTGARLVVERVAGQSHVSVHVTAKVPAAPARTAGATVAVHVGWRSDGAGGLQVATWRADTPLTVPPHLREVVVQETPTSGRIVLPARWREQMTRPDRVRSERDTRLEEVRTWLADWLATNPQSHDAAAEDAAAEKAREDMEYWGARIRSILQREVPDDEIEAWGPQSGALADARGHWRDAKRRWRARTFPGRDAILTSGRVKRWRSPNRFASLAHAWRDTPPVGDRGEWVAGELEAWRKWDRRRWETEAHGRRKATGRRRDAYRKVAAWMTGPGTYRVVVDSTDLAAIARAPRTGDPLPGAAEDAAASARVDAAPHELRDALRWAATREGCTVIETDAAGLTRVHAACGHENPTDGRYAAAAVVTCDGCGRRYDQDTNAVAIMLARVD